MNFLNYCIEANVGITVILIFYFLLLRKENHFNFKRLYLLTGIITSLLFPLITIQTSASLLPSFSQTFSSFVLPELLILGNNSIETSAVQLSYWSIVRGVYFFIVIILLLNVIAKLFRLHAFIKNTSLQNHGANFKIIENLNEPYSFSFFRFIIIGNTYSQEEKQHVIAHEMVHVKKFHSLDILLVEFLKIIFWFNPAVYILKKIFTSIHEFEADEAAVENCDVNQYCSLLARVALQSAHYPIANYFNNSLTLKRIAMIKTVKKELRPGVTQNQKRVDSLVLVPSIF